MSLDEKVALIDCEFERGQLPGDVRDTLAGALTGELRRRQLLFQAMVDTWLRLLKNLTGVLREVKKVPWKFEPFSVRDGDPSPWWHEAYE